MLVLADALEGGQMMGSAWVRGICEGWRAGIARLMAALLLLVGFGMWGLGQWHANAAPPAATSTNAPGSPFTAGVGTGPLFVAVGDFNGDGKLDVAVTNFGDNTVSMLLGNGNGTFTATTGSPFAVGSNPYGVVVGDFNGDGKLDLAAANQGSNTVSVLLGNGMGGFTAAAGSPIAVGNGPYGLVAGDLNGDGKVDLAATNSLDGTVSLLVGIGDGTFTASPGSPITVGAGPGGITTGDFNGDGKADLVLANNNSNNVSVLLNTSVFPFTLFPARLPAATVGTAFSQAFTASGGAAGPYTLAVAMGSTLPPGLPLIGQHAE